MKRERKGVRETAENYTMRSFKPNISQTMNNVQHNIVVINQPLSQTFKTS
jgi:hypothetical protein